MQLIGKQAKESLIKGVNAVADAVKVTMGAEGKTVIIRNKLGFGHDITKDGYKVAQNVEVDNSFDELGASLIRTASLKTVDSAADGTTTSTVITQALVNDGMALLDKGISHVEIREGIEIAYNDVITNLKKLKRKTSYSKSVQVGSISANNDKVLGKLVADVFKEKGVDVSIDVSTGYSRETTVSYNEGLVLERGWALPYFCTDLDAMKAEIENGKILVFNGDIQSIDQVAEQIRKCRETNSPMVIFANDFSTGVMEQLAKLKMEGTFRVLACISPDFGNNRDLILEDLSIYTGAVLGVPAIKQTVILGNFKKIVADKDKTVVVVEGVNEETKKRVLQISEQLEKSEDKFEKDKLEKRLSNIKNTVASILVGGSNEMEVKERKDRVDDSIGAVRSALKGGYVAGGGATLYYISENIKAYSQMSDGQRLGYELLRKSIQKPFEQILSNANLKPEDYIGQMGSYGVGVNVKTRKVENLIENGILDSALVIEIALDSAKNVAKLVLQTDCLISGEGF